MIILYAVRMRLVFISSVIATTVLRMTSAVKASTLVLLAVCATLMLVSFKTLKWVQSSASWICFLAAREHYPSPLPSPARGEGILADGFVQRATSLLRSLQLDIRHATLPLPLHRVRTVVRADESPRRGLARRPPATHIPLARRPTRAPAHAPADRRSH